MRKAKSIFRSVVLATAISISSLNLAVLINISPKVLAANDYPYRDSPAGLSDNWNFLTKNCTSYVAWRINRDAGTSSTPYFFKNDFDGDGDFDFGNALTWKAAALSFGFAVDNLPEVGDVAYWDANSGGALANGHVAYVESVNANGTVNISEYNFGVEYTYRERSNVTADFYIHVGQSQPGLHRTKTLTFSIAGQSRLYQFARGDDKGIYSKYTVDGSSWTDWLQHGSTNGNIAAAAYSNGTINRLFMTARGFDNQIYMKYTDDGNYWSGWTVMGSSPTDVTLTAATLGGVNYLFLAARGNDQGVYIKQTSDGISWSGWSLIGYTSDKIDLAYFPLTSGNKVVMTVRGTNGRFYSNYTANGINWSSWIDIGGGNGSAISSVLNNGSFNRLYQAIRGSDNHIYVHYSTDGIYWGGWLDIGSSKLDVDLENFSPSGNVADTRLYITARGDDNKSYVNWTNGTTWNNWQHTGGTYHEITLKNFSVNGQPRLYQVSKGYDSVIRWHYTIDGLNWSGWI